MRLYSLRCSIPIALCICLGLARASAEPMDSENYEQLWLAAFSYYAAARVCGDTGTIEKAKNSLRRVNNYGEFHKILSPQAKLYMDNPDYYILQGEKQYSEQKWVSCDQVRQYVLELDDATRQLP